MLTRLGLGTRRVLVQLGRQVFEVYLLVLAVMAGVRGVLESAAVTPPPAEPLLPPWGRVVWYGGLTLGAMIALVGIMLPLPHSVRVEEAGLLVLLGAGLAYVLLTFGANRPAGAVTVVLFLTVLVVRIVYIRWEPRGIAAAVRLIQDAGDLGHGDGER